MDGPFGDDREFEGGQPPQNRSDTRIQAGFSQASSAILPLEGCRERRMLTTSLQRERPPQQVADASSDMPGDTGVRQGRSAPNNVVEQDGGTLDFTPFLTEDPDDDDDPGND